MYPLQIPNITVDDGGIYNCVEKQFAGAADIASALLVVIVLQATRNTVIPHISDKGQYQSIFIQSDYRKVTPLLFFLLLYLLLQFSA